MRFIAASSGSSWFQLSKRTAVNANTRCNATRRDMTRCDMTWGQASCRAQCALSFRQWRENVNLGRTRDFSSFLSTIAESYPSYSLGGIDLDRSIKGSLFKIIIVTMTLWIIGYRRCIEPCKIRLRKSSSDFDANLIGILVQTRKPNLRSVNSKGFESIDSNELMLAMLDTWWSRKIIVACYPSSSLPIFRDSRWGRCGATTPPLGYENREQRS